MGRPSKYSPSKAARIFRAVQKGCSRQAAAALAGINPDTLYEWQRRYPEFSEGLEKADARFERACVASIRKAGLNKRNWAANSWLLERKFPQRFGRVDRHLIQTKGTSKPLPADYVAAINRALGISGVLKPLDNRQQLPVAREVVPVTPKQLPASVTTQSNDDEFLLENLP